jgi:hypothetical protein
MVSSSIIIIIIIISKVVASNKNTNNYSCWKTAVFEEDKSPSCSSNKRLAVICTPLVYLKPCNRCAVCRFPTARVICSIQCAERSAMHCHNGRHCTAFFASTQIQQLQMPSSYHSTRNNHLP